MAELSARERKWKEEQAAAEAAAELTAASLEEERAALEALAARWVWPGVQWPDRAWGGRVQGELAGTVLSVGLKSRSAATNRLCG